MVEKNELSLMILKVKDIAINNQSDYEAVIDLRRQLKEYKAKLDARHLPMKKKTHEAWKEVCDRINDYDKPIKEADGKLKRAMSDYNMQKERERRAEEDRLRREAEEKEKARIQAELKEVGYKKEEAEVEAESIELYIPEVKIVDNTKVEGVSYRTNYKYRIIDVSKIPTAYMIPDEKKIGGVVKSMKENTNIPGIEIYKEKTPIDRY